MVDFVLPDLGEGIHEAQIIQVLIREGDTVESDQPLMEVETDKAAVEIPSPHSGKVTKVHVHEGQTVNVGDVMVSFGSDQAAAEPAEPQTGESDRPARAGKPTAAAKKNEAASAAGESAPEPRSAAPRPEPAAALTGRPAKVAASPAVRRRAKELGVDLAAIPGSGPGGRVTRDDLEQAAGGGGARPATQPSAAGAAARAATLPAGSDLPDFTKWGPIRREPISQTRKTIANQMVRSEASNVHVTHHDLADIEMLEQLRKDHNARRAESDPKLTLLPFVIKAIHAAMRRYPQFNGSFDQSNNEMIYKDYFHFGIAVDTPRGLVVPVLRDVDRTSIRDLAVALAALGEKARTPSFGIDELRGGTFTITNIGSLGGIVSTPIINYPEVAILGLGKAAMQPVVRGGDIVARYLLPLNLSFDHRIIDGADAARFMSDIKGYLEVPGRLLLED